MSLFVTYLKTVNIISLLFSITSNEAIGVSEVDILGLIKNTGSFLVNESSDI